MTIPDKQELFRKIEQRCRQNGYERGWSLLYCPWHNLIDPDVALVTMNPAGCALPPGLSTEEGSAYVIQDWLGNGPGEAPLQKQIDRKSVV